MKKAAGVLFTDGKKILLLRIKGGDNSGKWCMPGGKSHAGETAFENAKRECQEEIGRIQGERFAQFEENNGFTSFLFKVNQPFYVRLSKEHDKSEWIDIDKVKKINLHPEFAKHFHTYVQTINKKFAKSFKEWFATVKN